MISLDSICQHLAVIAPLELAESWDNVGLLVGDRKLSARRVMTCLTISPPVVDEAVNAEVDLIVTHHPLPFHPLQRITADTTSGQMLLRLISAGVAIYSAHTAFDSAAAGINQMLADSLSLQQCDSLVLPEDDSRLGAGRVGLLPETTSLKKLIADVAGTVGASAPRRVGRADLRVSKVGFACGSGGSFLSAARKVGCDALITGEATFHTCLEAESTGIGLGLLGHYGSERFAMERLAERLSADFGELTIWPSKSERDPIERVDA